MAKSDQSSSVGVNSKQIEEDVRSIVAEILELEPSEIDPQSHFIKDLGMDSMMALEILASIEKKYRIVIPEESLSNFTDLTKTVNTVKDVLGKE